MAKFSMVFGAESIDVELPAETVCLSMSEPGPLGDPSRAIKETLARPIGSPSLDEIVRRKRKERPEATAAVVISDNTRPVPYRGEGGILAPVVDTLIEAGIRPDRIAVIAATGTHRVLSRDELERMIDRSVLARGVRIICHDCRDRASLASLGTTSRGTRVLINKTYLESDVKILTGLVESHFMAGTSGGRKSVCPGLVGEESTYVFHGPAFLSSPNARDLVLEGNPCHEESLEVARMAGVDFIINVTLNSKFEVTGIYAGDLEEAHVAATRKLAEYVSIPIDREYDIVVTHAGFVGINHYQAAKAAVVAIPVLKQGGRLVMGALNVDADPVGSATYRTVLHLLALHGPEAYMRLITSSDWRFVPDQWQVQMWAKVFAKIPMANFTYCAPHITPKDAAILPGRDGNLLLPPERRYSRSLADLARMVELAVGEAVEEYRARFDGQKREGVSRTSPTIAYLKDGPYGIPVRSV
ncbi:MAG: nickel-dependent lactate racemase [Firmicutes bacterium]|jgi:nickel-dependent lactate racemase|nr:nickel-dependent lactate racemase [Bacillota bacterium]MDH7494721.1 nickel-dependent lactate racemase [Bacillota bacterium]